MPTPLLTGYERAILEQLLGSRTKEQILTWLNAAVGPNCRFDKTTGNFQIADIDAQTQFHDIWYQHGAIVPDPTVKT